MQDTAADQGPTATHVQAQAGQTLHQLADPLRMARKQLPADTVEYSVANAA